MAQQKNSSKSAQSPNKKSQRKSPRKENPKTFGKEPPMVDPRTPSRPDNYEVQADESSTNESQPEAKPTLH